MRSTGRGILLGLALLVPTTLNAQLWYNGDPDDVTGWASENYATLYTPPSMVFESFTVSGSGWSVTSLFGHFITQGLSQTPTQASWEIRSGVGAGDGGNLLYSGTNSLAWALTGFGVTGFTGYLGTVTGFGSLDLGAGTYWLGISVIHGGPNQLFAATTGGANGVGAVTDGSAIHNMTVLGSDYALIDYDIAYGMDGRLNSTVPEPATMVLLASGLAGVGLVHLRRRRQA